MSANGSPMTDALTMTIDLQAQGCRIGTISIIGMVAIVRNLETMLFFLRQVMIKSVLNTRSYM